MGNGMNKILPGLYIGNYRDSKDKKQLDSFNITHILSIHDYPGKLIADKNYLCIMATDTPDQNLSQYFSISNDFIHAARIRNGNVLIHCLAGMSRSVTIAVAYVMTISNLSWEDALKVVKSGRRIANPNAGFQNQLTDFQSNKLREEKRRFRQRFPQSKLDALDKDLCVGALTEYDDLLKNKSICEGNCKLMENCPTGTCRNASQKKIFKPRGRFLSKAMSNSINDAAKSCPNSPSHLKLGKKPQSDEFESNLKPTMSSQSLRYRSSPAGLSSYTGVSESRASLTSDKFSVQFYGAPFNKGSSQSLSSRNKSTNVKSKR